MPTERGGGVVKAAVLRAVNEPLVIDDIQLDIPDDFEVSIEVAAAGLCGSDVHYMTGVFGHPLPAVLGHESAGVVVATGDRVTHVSPGDHVVTCLTVFCGTCQFCVAGRPAMCTNRTATGRQAGSPPRLRDRNQTVHQYLNLSSFAERMLVHENAVVKVVDELPFEQGALLGCGVSTGLGAVMNTAGVAPGETVAVVGCGGVGLSAIQGARISGASTIIAIDRVGEILELAGRLGATHTIDSSVGEPATQVREVTDGRGVDHAFEAIGLPETAELAFRLLKRGGTATIVGVMPPGATLGLPADAFFHERKIQGSNMGSTRFRIDIPRYAQMYLDGRLNLDDMVTNRYELEEINEGFTSMLAGRVARNVVVMDRSG
jgi:S-(hydroxymethyl)glutathione dehydrogenase/alcohol dehydrogenase